MPIEILHQVGHNSNWSRDSFKIDKVGTGLIYSPVHESFEKITNYDKELKETSIFDPQFYLPSSQKPKFKTYDFFPNTILGETGFNTLDYISIANESARRCVEFQKENNFSRIVIPSRFFEQLSPNYAEQQSELFVRPFLKNINEMKLSGTKIILTVPITSHMISIEEYKINILNWITSYPEINGVYFICQHDRKTKQITDTSFILKYMEVIRATLDADLDVIVGYTNTESLLYSICGDISLTIGAFENTRIFSLDKFVVSDEERRGPKPRIYLPKLLNWINFEEANLIKTQSPELWKEIYTESIYSKEAFKATKAPSFQTPTLYKHYFNVFSNQLETLSLLDCTQRYNLVKQWINNAIRLHERINDVPIQLDKHGNSDHLVPWLNAINIYHGKND